LSFSIKKKGDELTRRRPSRQWQHTDFSAERRSSQRHKVSLFSPIFHQNLFQLNLKIFSIFSEDAAAFLDGALKRNERPGKSEQQRAQITHTHTHTHTRKGKTKRWLKWDEIKLFKKAHDFCSVSASQVRETRKEFNKNYIYVHWPFSLKQKQKMPAYILKIVSSLYKHIIFLCVLIV
jgi:hypothetical protein